MSLLGVLLTACGSQAQKPDPAWEAQASPAQIVRGERVPAVDDVLRWGGRIQGLQNLVSSTRIEVLSYPLNGQGRPIIQGPASGRFLLEVEGFLEPHEFPPGALVSVKGRYARVVEGRIGEASYRYPLLLAERMAVWEALERRGSVYAPGVRWSLGVGSGGSGVGVGIGF